MAAFLTGFVHLGHAVPAAGTLLLAPAGQGIENSYIVVLKQDKVIRSATDTTAHRLATREHGRVGHVYRHGVQGFEVSLDEAAARRLAADPAVAYVEQNRVVRLQDSQFDPPNFGLDRIDQVGNPGDDWYTYPTTAPDVRVYVIDSGIQVSHFDFEFRVTDGASFGTTAPATTDCTGHGTHVAGIIGSATYGVAKGVTLTPVRVFDCDEFTSTGNVIAGLDWVYARQPWHERAVVNMSLDGPVNFVLETFVTGLVNNGVVVTVAAGNDRIDACSVSPARVPGAITVAGLDTFNPIDTQFTNFGPCVDFYAPATSIRSTWNTTDFADQFLNGTSMSAAFAAGVAAIYRSLHPSMNAAQIHDMMRQATSSVPPPTSYTRGFQALYLQQIVIGPQLPKVDSMQSFGIGLQLTAAGGVGPYRWSATGLPGGTTINPTTGYLGGYFGGAGDYTVTITATDATGRSGWIKEKWHIRRDPCPTC
ncbi:S8 family peptidase [Actinophytocola sp.]|uniref:S8 family peptidase n=1 Tax=Actinophytocola sp. TaxID=1872138 RepID=UPI002DDCA4B5|nr:S8 family peptidase [Actinophytocola sp.]